MSVRDKITTANNETYFITFTILDWQPLFINDEYCAPVYKWFDYIRDKYDNKIYGYVIMPNHLHCITKLSATSPDISKLIQNAKRFLAYELVALLTKNNDDKILKHFQVKTDSATQAKHQIFKRRFDSAVIQSEKFFLQKLNYIHNNPCQEKWHLADKPENYKHSSAANYILSKGYYKIDEIDF